MAITPDVRADAIARRLSEELARAEGAVLGLWLTMPRGVLTFWVLTRPIDLETQQRLYERTAVIYECFPNAEFVVHILNPEWYEGGDAAGALPPDAQPIPLPAAR
ncbi:MAG TPA: hypothetical protein VFE37_28275 [Chloroflexota bacterium]|nr:hypothetical protein [Chloroflexota bacterium]